MHGMFCSSDIYGCTGRQQPVLMCSRSVINDRFFKRLHDMYRQGMELYVDEAAYDGIVTQHEYLHAANSKVSQTIIDIRQRFGKILNQALDERRINMPMVMPMVMTLDLTVDAMDLSFILHWTSYMRDMDEYLQTHSTNVAILNGKLAQWMGMDKNQVKKAIMVGLLHDLGKTRIPQEILNKPAKLTPEEYEIVKMHPVYSWEIVSDSGITNQEVLAGIRGHHEKINGSGYPDGLKMDDITGLAKITEISDIYDAMVAQRVYKESRTPFEVLDEFFMEKFVELDMAYIDVFLSKMKSELMGKNVILSNGKIGIIKYIEEGRFRYPLVEVDGKVIQLDNSIQCVTLCTNTRVI